VLRRSFAVLALLLVLAPNAHAQMAPEQDAGTSSGPRPPPGPAFKERGGRRSRGASTASGALIVVVIVAAIGHYVWKKVRRY
jgi:hypothetical protein